MFSWLSVHAVAQLLISSEVAREVNTMEELEQFRAEGGMPRLLMALSPTPYTTKVCFVCPSTLIVDIYAVRINGVHETATRRVAASYCLVCDMKRFLLPL